MPRYALANKLYRGRLPREFQDLTWIEERVCARFSNTAVVTRLYQSSDPSQPTVFHGNTCAHEMNVDSTATVLPRAPSDVNGLLSVVFIGPSKFEPKYLGNMYRIRKSKVWGFLQWLKVHNRLYRDISLDEQRMDLYPDDGYLPGIEETVIHDDRVDADDMFKEETAGISEHPAELLNIPSEKSDLGPEPLRTMIEKTGVTDPECDRIPGRLFTSAALKNLVSDGSELPDLVLHRGSAAVSKYNNPDLIPGMYPTLFPVGAGGFDIPDRVCALSFANQAKYCLDLADRSFRYHHSFLFVVLNIVSTFRMLLSHLLHADMNSAVNEKPGSAGGIKPAVNVKSFLKVEEGNPFYVLPVISEPLFPQFKGPRSPGVIRVGHQQGACCCSIFAPMARCLISSLARSLGRLSLNPSQFPPSCSICPS